VEFKLYCAIFALKNPPGMHPHQAGYRPMFCLSFSLFALIRLVVKLLDKQDQNLLDQISRIGRRRMGRFD